MQVSHTSNQPIYTHMQRYNTSMNTYTKNNSPFLCGRVDIHSSALPLSTALALCFSAAFYKFTALHWNQRFIHLQHCPFSNYEFPRHLQDYHSHLFESRVVCNCTIMSLWQTILVFPHPVKSPHNKSSRKYTKYLHYP